MKIVGLVKVANLAKHNVNSRSSITGGNESFDKTGGNKVKLNQKPS